jgi:hypothetical protein
MTHVFIALPVEPQHSKELYRKVQHFLMTSKWMVKQWKRGYWWQRED